MVNPSEIATISTPNVQHGRKLTPSRFGQSGRIVRARVHVAVPLVVYLALVILSITTSSIGAPNYSANNSDSAALFSTNALRSDEYLTSSPIRIAQILGFDDVQHPAFAEDGILTLDPSTPGSAIVFWDIAVVRHLPFMAAGQKFAALWWLPTLICALALPSITFTLTKSRWPGWLLFALCAAAPVNTWWSGLTCVIVAPVAAAVALVLTLQSRASNAHPVVRLLLIVTSALMLARMPFLYQPFAIVLVLTLAIAIVAYSWPRGRNGMTIRPILYVVAVALLSVGLVAIVMLEHIDSLTALSSTVYPGSRRSAAGGVSIWHLFSAPIYASYSYFARKIFGVPALTVMNESELSTAYFVFIIPAMIGFAFGRESMPRRVRAFVWALLLSTGFWFVWTVVPLGKWSASIPLIAMVQPSRSGAVLGIMAAMIFCIVLPYVPTRSRVRFAIVSAALCSIVTCVSLWGFSRNYAMYPILELTIIVCLTTGLIAIICWQRCSVSSTLIVMVSLAISVVGVNPVQHGLGPIHDSDLARKLRIVGSEADLTNSVWASDSFSSLDPYFEANGVPSISGRQMTGPNEMFWKRLDPTGAHESVWNRGGSYVTYNFVDSIGSGVQFSNPNPDVISVAISPCDLSRMTHLNLVIVTSKRLNSCVVRFGELRTTELGGEKMNVYRVSN